MLTFIDGPAAVGNQCDDMLAVNAPWFLRMVFGPKGWRVLDFLEDEPAEDEKIFLYRRVRDYGAMLVRGKGYFRKADYVYREKQPRDEEMRTMKAWLLWLEHNCIQNQH